MSVNVRSLIREVHKRPILWDTAHKDHANRFLLERVWIEVATVLDAHVRDVRQKWKYLRDQHRREVKKIAESASLGAMAYEPSWKYYHLLFFLVEQINAKIEKAHCVPERSGEVPNISTPTNFFEEESSSSSTRMQYDEESPERKRKRTKFDIDEDLLAYLVKLEQKKVDILLAQDEAKQENSDDLYFMKSLLPIMKSFTRVQKLVVRNKILKIIIEEMNANQSFVFPEPSGN
ncbi:uncharacterized protein [Onthophagus taurus]|uniref:uncharacterized protein n=1 Tax=Onthophagus taurus TaxID=166361 RepID=UPI000C200719|nr:uncharacterized protein LOC111424951 [Onthophagus taurus]